MSELEQAQKLNGISTSEDSADSSCSDSETERNNKSGKSTIQWFLEFAGTKKKYYIFSILFAAAGAIFQLAPYFVISRMIQQLLTGISDFQTYLEECILIALLFAARCLLDSLSTACSHKAAFSILANIRRQGLAKLERMPLGDVQKRGSGELKNILVERVDSLETTLAHIIPEVTGNACVLILMIIYLFVLNWKMALASMLTMLIGVICMMLMMVGYEENFSRSVKATKNLNDTAVEYISGIEVIKVFGKAKSSYQKFLDAAREGASSYIDWMRICNLPFVFAMTIMPACLVSVLPIGAVMVIHGTLSVSDYIQILVLSIGLITPIITVLTYKDDWSKAGLILIEVTGILEAAELERPEKNIEPMNTYDVHLNNVRFGYDEQEVLHGITLDFAPGSVNALVGPSGSGKSTIAKLIAAFWDPDCGSVEIGSTDIRNLSSKEYYKNIAYVSQENFLFDTSVMENIRMGNPLASDEQVMQAARDCGCYDFILELENGFDTMVGSGGSHLSGGEKQRICIARAMLKNAPVVILDEATAYTDPENEALIQKAISALVKDKTLIVIAHRLSMIQDADQIILINNGMVEAKGTHEELLSSSELYSKLWNAHIRSRDTLEEGGYCHD